MAFLALLPLGNARSLTEMSALVRLVLALYSQAFYLVKTVWPTALSPLYPFPLDITYHHLAIAAAGTLLAGAALRIAPAWSATWAVYSLTLLPVSGIFHNGPQAVADRYSYLACLPWALWVGAAVAWRPRRAPVHRAVALALRTLVVATLLGLGALTWSQAGIWHDSIALWTHALAVNPDSRDAHGYLGKAYDEAGLAAGAVAHYAEAARRSHNRLPWYVAIARVLEEAGNDRAAMIYYDQVLRSAPGSLEACAGLRRLVGHLEPPPEVPAACLSEGSPEYRGRSGALHERVERGKPAGKLAELQRRRPRHLAQRDHVALPGGDGGRRIDGLVRQRGETIPLHAGQASGALEPAAILERGDGLRLPSHPGELHREEVRGRGGGGSQPRAPSRSAAIDSSRRSAIHRISANTIRNPARSGWRATAWRPRGSASSCRPSPARISANPRFASGAAGRSPALGGSAPRPRAAGPRPAARCRARCARGRRPAPAPPRETRA